MANYSDRRRESTKIATKRWRAANPEKYNATRRRAIIKRQYGLTTEEYEARLTEPCSICGAESKVMDHNHASGDVRGPLCQGCNLGLGHFKDDPIRLRRAADYLG